MATCRAAPPPAPSADTRARDTNRARRTHRRRHYQTGRILRHRQLHRQRQRFDGQACRQVKRPEQSRTSGYHRRHLRRRNHPGHPSVLPTEDQFRREMVSHTGNKSARYRRPYRMIIRFVCWRETVVDADPTHICGKCDALLYRLGERDCKQSSTASKQKNVWHF